MHIRFDFDQMMLAGTENPEQLDAGTLQSGVGVIISQSHFAPIHDALHPDALMPGMDQVIDKIIVIDAIDTDLDRAKPVRILPFLVNHLVDMVVDETFGMVRMVLLSFGEFWNQMQRLEVMVIPVDIALQLSRIQFIGPIVIRTRPIVVNQTLLWIAILQLKPVHEDIFFLGRNRMLAQMNDKRKLDAVDLAEMCRIRINIKIAGTALMAVPLHVIGIGINNIRFADGVAVDLKNDLQIGRYAKIHIEFYFSPSNIEFIFIVIDPLEKTS